MSNEIIDTSVPEHSNGWKLCNIIGIDGIYCIGVNSDKNILRIRHKMSKPLEVELVNHADLEHIPAKYLRADWGMFPPEYKVPPRNMSLLQLVKWWWNERK